MKNRFYVFVTVSVLLSGACVFNSKEDGTAALAGSETPDKKQEHTVTRAELNAHLGKREKSYPEWRIQDLSNRIQPAPPVLIDLLRKDNVYNGWPQVPESLVPSKDFKKDLVDAVNEMPEKIQVAIAKKLIGIFIVKNLGGSAFAELVYDAFDQPRYAMVVVDAEVLNRRANEWMTWKESSPFKTSKKEFLRATIASENEDSRKNALSYILLHEFGHVLSFGYKFDPEWRAVADRREQWGEQFFSFSWQAKRIKDFLTSVRKNSLPKEKDPFEKIPYYAPDEKRISAEKIRTIYKSLEESDFPTLYAILNPGDDFAEVFVNYVHVVLMKRPYKIEIFSDGALEATYASCWQKKRCFQKKDFLEKFLAAHSGH